MIYAMADIHGCFDMFKRMLRRIGFSDNDSLFVIGDILDRGEQPLEVLRDMSQRGNVFPVLGNHEYIALLCLKHLMVEITEENYANHFTAETMLNLSHWLSDGGQTTLDGFKKLSPDEREILIEYLEEFPLYETLELKGTSYLFVHSGLKNFSPQRAIDDYQPYELLFDRADYGRRYYNDIQLVTGHTPTFLIDEQYRGKIYRKNNHIALDCGAVYGERLGCICLDTGEEFYID